MSDLAFVHWLPRPRVVVRLGTGLQIYLVHPELRLTWEREESIHKSDGGVHTRTVRGHRMDVQMRWSMMPSVRLAGPGVDRMISGSEALVRIDVEDEFVLSLTGRDPWVTMYTVNKIETEYLAGDATPEGVAHYRSRSWINPVQLIEGWS